MAPAAAARPLRRLPPLPLRSRRCSDVVVRSHARGWDAVQEEACLLLMVAIMGLLCAAQAAGVRLQVWNLRHDRQEVAAATGWGPMAGRAVEGVDRR